MDLLDAFKSSKEAKTRKKVDDALVAEVMKNYAKAKDAKTPFKEEWKEYYKLYRGEQYKKGGNRWQSKAMTNYVFQVVESFVPLMSDRQPAIQILPMMPDDAAIAQEVQDVVRHRWNRDSMRQKIQKILRDMIILGTGLAHIRFDSELSNGLGDVTIDSIDPFDFFPDDAATSFESMDWCILKTKRSAQYFKDTYGKDIVSPTKEVDDQLRDTTTYMEKPTDTSLIDEFQYFKKEKGKIKRIIIAGQTILDERVLPYAKKSFPFVAFHNHSSNGELWSMGDVKQIASLQKKYNKIDSVVMDNMIATNNAIWIVDSTAGIKKGSLRNEPGLIVEKSPGGQVKRESPPPLPNYFMEAQNLTRQQIQDVSGVQDITQKLNNATGPAMQTVVEYTQTRLRAKLQNFETSIQQLGEWMVEMIREHYTEPRIIRITKPNMKNQKGEFDFMTFDASKLKPEIPQTDPQSGQPMKDESGVLMMEEGAVYFDIEIASGSSMLLNRSAKYEQALQLYGAGAVDIETLLEAAEIGNPKTILDNLIKYGVIKDPEAPQVDLTGILNELGVRFNMTTNEPELITQAISKFRTAEQRANQLREMKKSGASPEEMDQVAKAPLEASPPQAQPQNGIPQDPSSTPVQPEDMGEELDPISPEDMDEGQTPQVQLPPDLSQLSPELLQALLAQGQISQGQAEDAGVAADQLPPELIQQILQQNGQAPE